MKENNSWDTIWENVFLENEWGKYPSENLIRFIARNFYKLDRPNVKILELGCGTGANIWYITREGFDAYGIDGSKTAITQAKKRLSDEKLSATLVVGDIINLPFENNYFDAVIDVECIYANNLANTKHILAEAKRVLKLNGKIYSRTFSDKMFIGTNYQTLAENEYTAIEKGPLAQKGFVRLSSKDSVKKLYQEFFTIISIDLLESTQYNEEELLSEYILIAQKKK